MSFFVTKNELNYAFRLWLQKWKADKGFTNLQIAYKTGASPATIGFLLNGDRNVSETKMREMAHKAGFDLKEILRPYITHLDLSDVEPFKEGEMEEIQQELDAEERRSNLKLHPAPGNLHLLTADEMEERGFFTVPFSDDMKLAAGGGGTIPVSDDAENSVVVVHGPSIKRRNAKKLQAFRVGGDSMEPLIAEDGIVLADLAHNDIRHIKDGRIYVLCWDLENDGECAVKYLKWFDKGKIVSIESEDRFYKPVLKRIDEVILIGKVIWSWREFPD